MEEVDKDISAWINRFAAYDKLRAESAPVMEKKKDKKVDEDGNPYDGRAIDKLGIASLCSELIQDAQIRSLSQDNANAITPAFISRYLADGHPSRIHPDIWSKLKGQYATEHLKRLQAEIKNEWASKLQDVPNIIFTGGGAALLASIQPKLRQVFIIPENPQTASVRGSYDRQMSKV